VQQGFCYNELSKVARIFDLCFEGISNNRFELIPALMALLRVMQIPCIKNKSSDELYEVPKLSQVFNSFCNLLMLTVSDPEDEQVCVEWENARQELATTIYQIGN